MLVAILVRVSCTPGGTPGRTQYQLDNDTQGVIEKTGNLYNTSIVSNDPNVYKAEYEAGFIQGKLQKDQIVAAPTTATTTTASPKQSATCCNG